MLQTVGSLTDDSRRIIYDCNKFIVQATLKVGHHIPRFWKIRQLPAFGRTESNVDAARTRYWQYDRGNTLTAVSQLTVWKIAKPLEPFHQQLIFFATYE